MIAVMNTPEHRPGQEAIGAGWPRRLARSLPPIGGLGYLVLGTLWIRFSDGAGASLFTTVEELTAFQTYKGALFVAVSACFVYLLLCGTCNLLRRLPQMESRLHDSEELHRSLVELSPDGVVVHGDGRIIRANRAFRRALGLGETQPLEGVLLTSLVDPAQRPALDAQLQRVATEVGSSMPIELRVRSQGGQEIEVEHASGSVRVGDRIIVQSHFRDLSARNQARHELELANQHLEQRISERTRELQAANEALQTFTSSVAHDLRAPVAHVGGFARAVQRAMAAGDLPKATHYAARIVANAELMSDMIEGLLKLARAEQAALRHESLDSVALVEQVIADLDDGSARQRIAIGPLAAVQADRAALRQVWTNLIANALKYSAGAADPLVQITCADGPAETVFRISDRGIGFDPADADRLFGLFQRLPGAGGFPGTGIGLTIVRRIVERHGGRVWATGQPGRGATFSFALPSRR
jgi:PAS domain S-box-containing protein